MCFDICAINIRVSIRVRGLHLVFNGKITKIIIFLWENHDFLWENHHVLWENQLFRMGFLMGNRSNGL